MSRLLACALLAGVLTAFAAAPASGHGVIRREGNVLRFTAPDPGVGAHVTISSPRRGTVNFHDTTSPGGMDWGPCVPATERLSSCPTRGVARIEVEVYDGDDRILVTAATPVRVIAGEGNDLVKGGFGNDALLGGSGGDVLDGGQGRDALDGAEGDDTILARDGAADQPTCGAGTDALTADREDAARGDCERLARAAPARDRRRPRARLSADRRQRLAGARSLEATVSMSEPGTLTLGGSVVVGGRRLARLTSARARPEAPDQRWTVRLRIPRRLAAAIRRAVGDGRSAVAAIAASSRDRAGNRGRIRRARVRIAR